MRGGTLRLVVGALIVVAVIFTLVFSIVGQWPSDAPSEDQPTEEMPEDVITPVGPAGGEEALKDQQPPEE